MSLRSLLHVTPKTRFSCRHHFHLLSSISSAFTRRRNPVTCNTMPLSISVRPYVSKEAVAFDPKVLESPPSPPLDQLVTSYESAIAALNSLQSNAAVIEASKKNVGVKMVNIARTKHYLRLVGVTDDQIDNLNIIHVTGTKGKGSTCAFTESILRCYGVRTGFYSSPHLVAVRERIRLNGEPMSEANFANYFWSVYSAIRSRSEESIACDIPPLPTYFMFLTIMAFKVFIEEGVEAAIVEVGIGGEYDCTNVIRRPVVTGITSLALDHTIILGDTIDHIAWQKAGILKIGSPAFTVNQLPEALQVIKNRAAEKMVSSVAVVEEPTAEDVLLGIPGHVQGINANLAVHLSHEWLKRFSRVDLPIQQFAAKKETINGLRCTRWPGRCQVFQSLTDSKLTFFLDGAHTKESIDVCVQWFKSRDQSIPAYRILLFNCTGYRKPIDLLKPLLTISDELDCVLFSPNKVFKEKIPSGDQSNFTVDNDFEERKAVELANLWRASIGGKNNQEVNSFQCLSEAVTFLHQKNRMEPMAVQVLVTGSLHLVGGVLGLIDPNLTSFSSI